MKTYPIYLQDDKLACGVYCLKMILKYYGYQEDILELKNKARMTTQGTTIKGLVETLKSYQIESIAYKASLEDIQENMTLPCILHTIEDDTGHFVVLYDIHNYQYTIGDPAQGLIVYDKEELQYLYTGYVISITHIGRYYDYHDITLKSFLKDVYKKHKKQFLHISKMTFLSTIMSILCSSIYSFIIDKLKTNSPLIYTGIIICTYFIVSMIKIACDHHRHKQDILLKRILDKEHVYMSIINTLSLPDTYFYNSTSSIQDKIMGLFQLVDYICMYYKSILVDSIMIILYIGSMMVIDYMMGIMITILSLLLFLYMKHVSKKLMQTYKQYIHYQNKHASKLYEFLSLRDIGKRYLKKKWIKYYEIHYERYRSSQQELEEDQNKVMIQVQIFTEIIIIMTLLLGLYFYHKKLLTIGQILLFYMIESMMISPILSICSVMSDYSSSILLFERYKELSQSIDEPKDIIEDKVTSITFNNVSYSYGYTTPVLSHIDFKIDHNIFLLGDNGSGKTTLLQLMNGFDRNYKGEILINNQELSSINKNSLHDHICFVSGEESFFEGQISDNIFVHDNKKIERISKILDFDIILDQTITTEGLPLSQGERQLLILARALLQEKDVYLLDEVFSHISYTKSKEILKNLSIYYPDTLFIIVTHQIYLMNPEDEYVIMREGKIRRDK